MLTVFFSCEGCGLVREPVEVRARGYSENVVDWMEKTVIQAVARRHSLKSLLCEAKKMKDLLVPMHENAEWIGQEMTAEEAKKWKEAVASMK